MKEKFADYEGAGYLEKEGEFVFTVDEAELTESKAGDPMWKFTMKSPEGMGMVYHSLAKNARWSLNRLIAACLNLTPEQKATFELDYETVGQDLIGHKFIATVKRDTYIKESKRPTADGRFEDVTEEKVSYKIDSSSYKPVE